MEHKRVTVECCLAALTDQSHERAEPTTLHVLLATATKRAQHPAHRLNHLTIIYRMPEGLNSTRGAVQFNTMFFHLVDTMTQQSTQRDP